MPRAIAKSFQATLERMRSRLNWIIVRIPFDVAKTWGTRGQVKVKGEINGFAFRTSLFPAGQGEHILLVNKRMQAGGKVQAGAVAKIRLEPDTEERTATTPEELAAVFSEEPALGRWYQQLNYSTRKYIGEWITDVRSAAARTRRAEQIAERLLATMEAERELPPILRVAFDRNPRAYEGWKRMSAARRRSHLLGIFYYREPASRARRVAQAVQDAFHRAARSAKEP
jgi:uncharacterized protein YdeI (YjbR/CyaY-like superfamily)